MSFRWPGLSTRAPRRGGEVPLPLPHSRHAKFLAEQADEHARRQRRDAEMAA